MIPFGIIFSKWCETRKWRVVLSCASLF
ncbi:hypothetical protein BDFB_013337 [Asbolus verrucosus]|uniref:Uncharacterized protein n=1 Tax=Asbolus verrucosus TaxID=1661398 RepID=A0A482VFZ2_ASBVE|nr:hypothetical protein BDFB_013337 [Asbolus verrucosus]